MYPAGAGCAGAGYVQVERYTLQGWQTCAAPSPTQTSYRTKIAHVTLGS